MSAQPSVSSLPTLNMAAGTAAVAVAWVVPLAMIAGWAPVSYLLASVLAGMITAGLLLLFFRTRNRLWLNVNFFYMVLPVAQLWRLFDVHDWALHTQGVCISLLPTLVMFILGRKWIDQLQQNPIPLVDLPSSGPV